MNVSYTEAGTPVVDLTEDEYRAFLDREVRERAGMPLDEFVRLANAGEIDWNDPEAFSLAGLIGVGEGSPINPSRNGHHEP